jgi:IS605 OrfB family transposase
MNITFSKDITDISPNGEIIGIDRGINNLAVSSNNKFYSGKKVKHISNRYKRQRQKLQKKNTKSAKRHLRSVGAKESRFKADINHCISKQIIADLNTGDTVVLEDLSKVRKNSNKKGKVLRTLVNNWNFYQLEQFIKYKAEIKGITVVKVNAAYTSQICSKCVYQHKDNRKGHLFDCQKCSFRINADLNAARNIKLKHSMRQRRMESAVVNQPNELDFVKLNVSIENDLHHSRLGTSPLQASLGEGN